LTTLSEQPGEDPGHACLLHQMHITIQIKWLLANMLVKIVFCALFVYSQNVSSTSPLVFSAKRFSGRLLKEKSVNKTYDVFAVNTSFSELIQNF
jgi:hypothetical protein